MNPNETENVNSTNDTEITENQEEVVIEETTEETQDASNETVEDTDALKKQIETLKAQKEHWKNKASKPTEKPQATQQVANSKDLSQTDLYALIRNNIAEEDVSEIVDYAKLKKISIAEALKSSVVKTIIAEKDENRKVAQATNTGATRRGSTKVSDDALLSKASKGELPDSDEDLVRLIRARKGLK